jgi:hypothetical protein
VICWTFQAGTSASPSGATCTSKVSHSAHTLIVRWYILIVFVFGDCLFVDRTGLQHRSNNLLQKVPAPSASAYYPLPEAPCYLFEEAQAQVLSRANIFSFGNMSPFAANTGGCGYLHPSAAE